MKRIVAIALVMLIGVSIIGCGKDKRTDAEKFVGTWELEQNGEPGSWTETLVVFSDGTAYSTSYPNKKPEDVYEAVYNSWTMENGYMKYNITALGTTEDAITKYEFIDSDTLVLGEDSEEYISHYHRVK